MPDNDEFFIVYKNEQVKVSTILNGAKIYFSVHLSTPVVLAEGVVNNEFVWYDVQLGTTTLATELGEIIDEAGV